MTDWEWNPETYLAEMLAEIPGYEELQEAVVAATVDVEARRVLELGTGTGETAARVWPQHPDAIWVGIDASEPMLARARQRLPKADLRLQRLEDELPAGPFDLVLSVLAVHPGEIFIDWVMDLPDSVEDQLSWLEATGFEAEAHSVRADLAVLVGRLPVA